MVAPVMTQVGPTLPASRPATAADTLPIIAAPSDPSSRALHTVTSFHDEASGRLVYRVTDTFTGLVISELPPERLLAFFASYEAEGQSLDIAC